ncbi:hypothetical protein, partial [Streptomyces vietnamensis]|uniref:hypothetical protein n=1 Tax=Streptomyces vietnamensis TaxID=362257 RepID=UPI00341E47DD
TSRPHPDTPKPAPTGTKTHTTDKQLNEDCPGKPDRKQTADMTNTPVTTHHTHHTTTEATEATETQNTPAQPESRPPA